MPENQKPLKPLEEDIGDKQDKLVTAMTLVDEDNEYDEQPKEVTGKFYVSSSPFNEWPPQCFVDGVQVDPDTVKLA